jgi:hypothetical protein
MLRWQGCSFRSKQVGFDIAFGKCYLSGKAQISTLKLNGAFAEGAINVC